MENDLSSVRRAHIIVSRRPKYWLVFPAMVPPLYIRKEAISQTFIELRTALKHSRNCALWIKIRSVTPCKKAT